jgi:hypothetical protein
MHITSDCTPSQADAYVAGLIKGESWAGLELTKALKVRTLGTTQLARGITDLMRQSLSKVYQLRFKDSYNTSEYLIYYADPQMQGPLKVDTTPNVVRVLEKQLSALANNPQDLASKVYGLQVGNGFCLMCNTITFMSIPMDIPSTGNIHKGFKFWFSEGSWSPIKSYIDTAIGGIGGVDTGMLCCVAGICGVCPSRCDDCKHYPTEEFQAYELLSLRDSKLCGGCNKSNLTSISIPKLDKQRLVAARRRFDQLEGGRNGR